MVDPEPEGKMIDPQTFATEGKAWIEAVGQVLTSAIGTAGTIGLAAIALFQNLRLKAEVKDRLDRQSARLDSVMLATNSVQPTEPPKP